MLGTHQPSLLQMFSSVCLSALRELLWLQGLFYVVCYVEVWGQVAVFKLLLDWAINSHFPKNTKKVPDPMCCIMRVDSLRYRKYLHLYIYPKHDKFCFVLFFQIWSVIELSITRFEQNITELVMFRSILKYRYQIFMLQISIYFVWLCPLFPSVAFAQLYCKLDVISILHTSELKKRKKYANG